MNVFAQRQDSAGHSSKAYHKTSAERAPRYKTERDDDLVLIDELLRAENLWHKRLKQERFDQNGRSR